MPILLDHQLREQIPQDILSFPIAFYCDELAELPNHAGPMHWHPYFEIATAQSNVLDYQVGQNHVILEPGDSIFVNQNMLHGIRQMSGTAPDHMPVIIFSGTAIAPENSAIYQTYIQPVLACSALPFVVFRQDDKRWENVRQQLHEVYQAMQELKAEGGIAARHRRYVENHRVLVEGMRSLGFQTLLADEAQGCIITSFLYPSADFNFADFYERLKAQGFVIYPGKISEADTFRIGNIGDVFPDDFRRLIEAVREVRQA